ncbi:hypothetical protein [Virgibacillus sp. YIM 98842]|uniref:hypothetical protein n=1 Tax=Virgibacillus sp. YIM 98842 TaxID=2663533 RepID=UPI0013DB8AD7|nr:hypothetical protein [Virgibacillus sp. YIM 98842]
MQQLSIFGGELPEPGDSLETPNGKIKVIGYRTTWGGQELILWEEKGFLKGCPPDEFMRGEFE